MPVPLPAALKCLPATLGNVPSATRLIILGSTGSIGTQALEVVAHLNAETPGRIRVVGLAAGRNGTRLNTCAERFGVTDLALCHAGAAPQQRGRTRIGPDAAERLVREVECDVVLAAMVGVAGLPATLAAIELGRTIALANKETLVAAGALVVPAAHRSGSVILPVDSEHSGVWQALGATRTPPFTCGPEVSRVTLTASGGAFREWSADRTARATPHDALHHPTWRMGPKVTLDSASLMNKALELIEAHWLFGLPPEKLHAVIHPQSVVHALVEYIDRSVVAHLACPDMRLPIQVALTHPHRAASMCPRLDLASLARLEFEAIDPVRFPAISFARHVMERGGTSGATLNAANEEAAARFLNQDGQAPIPFGRIAEVVGEALSLPVKPLCTLADVHEADAAAREFVARRLGAKVRA